MSKKESKTIEAEVEVVSSKKSQKQQTNKPATKNQQQDNPFPGMAGMGGMGAMSGADGMPDLSAMFGKNGMPDLSQIPGLSFRQRMTFKIVGFLSNPKLRFLKSKWSIPIWGVVAILILAIIICAGLLLLVYKLLKAIISPYINIFNKKNR